MGKKKKKAAVSSELKETCLFLLELTEEASRLSSTYCISA